MKRIIIFMLLTAMIVTSSMSLISCDNGSGEDLKSNTASTTDTQLDSDEFNSEINNDNTDNNDNNDNTNNTNNTESKETYELLTSTDGLDFKLASSGKYYELIGIGTCTATDIFVDSYNGLPVAGIGDSSFKKNSTIKSITFGDNVKTISGSAFMDASALTSVKIGKSVSYIGDDAFYGCAALTDVVIESNVLTSLSNRVFMRCSNLKNVNIPSTVTNFGEAIFDACYEINFNVYGNSKYIGNSTDKYIYLFKAESQDIVSVDIPSGVKAIADTAFFGCKKLVSVIVPDSVTYVGSHAFYECSDLTSVKLGKNVKEIGSNAFSSCSSLKNINMPSSVTSIGGCAFSGCDNIEGTIYENAKYLGDENNAYYYLLSAKNTSITNVTVHKDTVILGVDAFEDCTVLETVILPDGLKYIKDSAFRNCYALTSINIPASVIAIDSCAFVCCKGLKSINLPDGVNALLPHLFSSCEALESVNISSNVFYIASGVFNNCFSLKTITFRGTTEQWNKLSKYGNWNEGTGDYQVVCNDETINK